ncbi:MAG: phosphate/phosphite/phosphonate ABC transporter substrate-binding protein [Desulfobacteraceae bacterium]|nr:phosphate/phosphite/phosphonate ABC transporter substrate-binding protein [Desulfobacteraceae bacterium]
MGRAALAGIVAWFLVFGGCTRQEPPIKVDLSNRAQIDLREEADVVTYAYLPQYSHTVSYQRHHLLVEYIRRETGLNMKQIFPDTFDQHMKMVGQDKVDISFSNPFIYAKIVHRYGARAFARIVEDTSRDRFRGQIICRADNPAIMTIEDCGNKSWIAVDSSSAGGYLFPLGHFLSRGIQRSAFKEIAFSPGPGGKQEKVVLSVHAGKYDVGTIREGALNVVAGRIDLNEIRVIASTPWYPGWVYAARKGLSPSIVEKVRNALLKLDFNREEHREILAAADFLGVIASDDTEFDSIRELALQVGISLE